jgi:pyrrolidone-carboxylate peptidase
MKNVLIAGFKGNNNSAKILLDNIACKTVDIFYLDNDFEKSETQLINCIKNKTYDFIFIFGQKPVIKSIYIEQIGQDINKKLETNFDFNELNMFLQKYYKTKISKNAGKYLCNNIYFKGLKYIKDNKLNIKLLFIHIPYIKNMDIKIFSKIFMEYIMEIV